MKCCEWLKTNERKGYLLIDVNEKVNFKYVRWLLHYVSHYNFDGMPAPFTRILNAIN